MSPSPPRAFSVLLRLALPARDRDALPRELEDLYRARVAVHGRRRARRWYRRQVLHFLLRLSVERPRRGAVALFESPRIRELIRMDDVLRDLRLAGRLLLRRPGFTLVAVLSLTLGIGANTAMFSLVNAVLLREPPVESPETLVDVYTSDSDGLVEHATFSWPDYLDLRAAGDAFGDAVAFELFIGVTEPTEGPPELLMGEVVSGNYFDMLGVRPALGRGFGPDEDREPGEHPVVVVSHAFWRTRMGGAPDVLGRTVRINQHPYTVVGVAPEDFRGLFPALVPDVWAPMAMVNELKGSGVDRLAARGSRSLFVKARLAPDVTVDRARAWLGGFAERLAAAHPETNEGRRMSLVPTSDVSVHPDVDRALVPVAGLLLGVVGVVLLIACANLASFLLARAEERRKDFAVRLALGAGRTALVRQLLVETVVLALVGAAGGVVLARATLDLLLRFQPPLPLPLNLDLTIDGTVLAFTAGVAVVAGLAFGLVPALQATRPDVAPALKTGGDRVAGRSGIVWR
ncbi:MAG TPA: ABC transporter permease, partial [Longimicrobiales bacterium]|nr:ABC transporter permease [Longimicrobiales bacterium]